MTKSQRKATILGRLVGMATSIYFWFIYNIYGSNPLAHKSIFEVALEDENIDMSTVLGLVAISSLILTLLSGFISRLLFSFRDDE